MIGLVVWGVLFGALLAYQGFCLLSTGDRWPAMTDLLRVALRSPVGRWVLFGTWLWIGWHLFVRTYRFLPRA
ncbi:MAG: hypothetical protein HY658_03955 [Actinobacteria bacterium]|nr:hypothetical protein [Actinomycetota bacterium]